ncbi:hypothetical protein [Streptomyces sp. NPDC014623]|uniref:hypothetical protein n=1 Tax=Streptomyces sp. NPDC014623 TaxID=3364875 RepID=UPI0036F9B803
MLTHTAAGLDLPDDVDMPPAHYAVYVEARRVDPCQGYTLLRLGPYTQARHASWDADRIDAALKGQETAVRPGFRVSARPTPFNVSDHQLHTAPYETDAVALLADAVRTMGS